MRFGDARLALALIAATLVLQGCFINDWISGSRESSFDCGVLTPTSGVRFSTEFAGIGGVQLEKFSQSDGNNLVAKCTGFHITVVGRIGSTQNIEGQNGWVELVWAGGALFQINLRAGWEGSTERGIKLGMTKSQVAAAYPEAVERAVVFPYNSSLQVILHPEEGEDGTSLYFLFNGDGALGEVRIWS